MEELFEQGAEKLPGSGISELVEWLGVQDDYDFVRAVVDTGLDDAARLLNVADDYAGALEDLLAGGYDRPAGLFSLGRSLGESVMQLLYLFDPGVTPERRVVRQLAFQVAAIEGNLGAVNAFGLNVEEADHVRVRDAIDGLHRFLSRAGIERGTPKSVGNTSLWVGRRGVNESLGFNATDAFNKYMPDSSFQWVLGSGATHSKGWMLPTLVGAFDEDALATPAESVIGAVTGLLSVSDAFSHIAEKHAGLDLDWLRKATHLRRMGLLSWREGFRQRIDHKTYAHRRNSDAWRTDPSHLGQSFRRGAAS
ncbi:hypothetical protein ASF30_13815 [Leifsonia sp. Leaf264]|nr:hypothetical protein ASF30_13815 [Leifsonia sp. Leaf264]